MTYPAWLHGLSIGSLVLAGLCALAITLDEVRRPQAMAVMNLVWPLTALFGSVVWLAIYGRWGRARREDEAQRAKPPFAISVLTGASHCGAGCTLGDMLAEGLVAWMPGMAVWFGWHWLFAEKTFALWIPDFILAFLIGIGFQYWAIKPMSDLSPSQALIKAVKADTISISAWQLGMYGGMAALQFGWLRPAYGAVAQASRPEFWFVMQLAMLLGFATSYPANWWLLRAGVKHAM